MKPNKYLAAVRQAQADQAKAARQRRGKRRDQPTIKADMIRKPPPEETEMPRKIKQPKPQALPVKVRTLPAPDRCAGTTLRGERCRLDAADGSDFCPIHQPKS